MQPLFFHGVLVMLIGILSIFYSETCQQLVTRILVTVGLGIFCWYSY